MLSSLVLQLMIDVLLITVMAWLWIQQKKQVSTIGGLGISSVWEKKIGEYEQLFRELQESLGEEKRKTQSLHDRIQKLIEQGALTSTIFPMSQEEEELKSLVPRSKREEEIPTLKQIEITRDRLDKDTSVDLRTILRDQLV